MKIGLTNTLTTFKYVSTFYIQIYYERKGNTLELIGIDSDFLNWAQMVQQLIERINKWNYIKLKMVLNKRRNGFYIEEASHTLGENNFQLSIWQGINNENIQDIQKTQLSKKSMTQRTIGKWTEKSFLKGKCPNDQSHTWKISQHSWL
jgi:hypothetical protein